jgi:uncharacterized protein YjiS (DUF1127 family)
MTVDHVTLRDDALVRTDAPGLLARLWGTLVERQRTRRMHAEADALDDRMLRDIGITRYDLSRARRFIP